MNLEVAQQDDSRASYATNHKPDYYGLGVYGIAKLLHCKPTRACELKQEAEAGGFIKTEKHFRELGRCRKPNFRMKEGFGDAFPERAKAVRFKKVTRNNQELILMLEQLHDEIKPNVAFKKVKRFIHL